MRGFTMILVVLNHVTGFCLGVDNVPSLNIYFYEFRMPLFFFVSGFVLYKSSLNWNLLYSYQFLKKKFPIQIISTCIFFFVFVYVNRLSLEASLWSDSKVGYWFTFVLFEFFLFYSILRTSAQLVKLNGWKKDVLILLSGIAFFVLTIHSVTQRLHIDQQIFGLLCGKHWCYFAFFVIGTLVKKHFVRFQNLLDGKLLITCCLVLFFGMNVFREAFMSVQYNLFRFLTAITGIFIILCFFRSREELFSKKTVVGRSLCYVGRRTLDIYFLHYFLLPLNLSAVVQVFHQHPMPILEFIVSFIISIAIISVCLIISNVLRLSPLLARVLFGVRQ